MLLPCQTIEQSLIDCPLSLHKPHQVDFESARFSIVIVPTAVYNAARNHENVSFPLTFQKVTDPLMKYEKMILIRLLNSNDYTSFLGIKKNTHAIQHLKTSYKFFQFLSTLLISYFVSFFNSPLLVWIIMYNSVYP